MLDNSEDFKGLVYTVTEIAKADNFHEVVELLTNSQLTISQTHYDNWNGGQYGYTIDVAVDVKTFIAIKERLENVEATLLTRFNLATRHLDDESIARVIIVPKAYAIGTPSPNPHRPFTAVEVKRREELIKYMNNVSEDELIAEILLPLFRQLGFHRVTVAGHKDKALEYGKDIWMKVNLQPAP